MQNRSIALLLAVGALAACEKTTLSGPARVVDGDSLEIGSTSVRIHGIDAPEGRQRCLRAGSLWDCGAAATAMLRNLVAARTIRCVETAIDSYGRTVARCHNGDVDLGSQMVLAGLALAYREYGSDYVGEEARAESAGAGIWAGEFTRPWEWRRHPVDPVAPSASAAASEDADCRIKGNVNSRGDRIYHVPGSHSYEQTKIDIARGERWFCTEADALGAGWRAPRG